MNLHGRVVVCGTMSEYAGPQQQNGVFKLLCTCTNLDVFCVNYNFLGSYHYKTVKVTNINLIYNDTIIFHSPTDNIHLRKLVTLDQYRTISEWFRVVQLSKREKND